jgi:hypothetical protein
VRAPFAITLAGTGEAAPGQWPVSPHLAARVGFRQRFKGVTGRARALLSLLGSLIREETL